MLRKAVGSGLRIVGSGSAEVAVQEGTRRNIVSSCGPVKYWGHIGMHGEDETPLPVHKFTGGNVPRTPGSAGWKMRKNLRAGGKVFPAEGTLSCIGTKHVRVYVFSSGPAK